MVRDVVLADVDDRVQHVLQRRRAAPVRAICTAASTTGGGGLPPAREVGVRAGRLGACAVACHDRLDLALGVHQLLHAPEADLEQAALQPR
eukprot:363326-Chlamydomonas_euryale.AAC.2